MRVFDSISSQPSMSSAKKAKSPKAPGRKAQLEKNHTRARVEMTPEQIRAKVAANNSGKASLKEKLAKTKEISSFLSEDAAARVSLTSINKNSQKFPKIEHPKNIDHLPENLVAEEANSTDEIFEAQVEISEGEQAQEGEELDPDRPGAMKNDPNNSITVNKLKEALNTGAFKVDAKTRKVLGEIISNRTSE